MAIAFDAYTGQADNSTTSQTISHTCTGSDRLILVSFITNNTTDIITGVTYNGVSMTKLKQQASASPAYLAYTWGLLNPASGANNVVVSASSASLIWTNVCSYTGVLQSGLPDATSGASNTSDTVWSSTLTTIADNAWHHTQVRGSATLAASAGTTKRGEPSGGTQSAAFDSGGAITPAGSDTNNGTNGTSNSNGSVVSVSFAPSVAATANSGFLQFM